MRIAVDARHLTAGRGVARYTRRMLQALGEAFPGDERVAFVPGREPLPAVPGTTSARHPLGGRILFGAAALTGRPRLDRLAGPPSPDVVWLPAPAPVSLSVGMPYVMTVHDLSWVQRPSDFTPYERAWHALGRIRRSVERASAIAASSEATRDALVGEWAIPPERIRVVHLAPGLTPSGAPPPAPVTSRPFFLAVGGLEPRKAPDLLARAFAAARTRGLDADLVFAGSGRLADALAGDGVRIIQAPGDDELAGLYRGALALVAPAWLEGFGMTPVEAAAFGTPSIVADLPVYAETLGDAAVRVPPGDEAALADALLALAGDPARRARLAAQAAENVAGLSWDRVARETRAILAEAAGC